MCKGVFEGETIGKRVEGDGKGRRAKGGLILLCFPLVFRGKRFQSDLSK